MTQEVRRLRILLIDDNNPDTCVDGIRNSLVACLGDDNFAIDYALNYAAGEKRLRSGLKYDLILFDIVLDGDHEWGGCELMDRYWPTIKAHGSKVILYSGKTDAMKPFNSFNSGHGPFLFCAKLDEFEPGEAFIIEIVRLLKEHVSELCQCASLQSAVAVVKENAPEVVIEGETWDVESLLAPWIFKLNAEEKKRQREPTIRALFPSNNLVRVFSYWFKGQKFMWPNDNMYGLASLAPYHVGMPSGPMDALTHSPQVPNVPLRFAAAAQTALDDLEALRNKLSEDFMDYLRQYIRLAHNWPELNEAEAMKCKSSVMFRLDDIALCFAGARLDVSKISGWELKGDYEFYAPGVYVNIDGVGGYQPSIKYAAYKLAQSVKERARGPWTVIFEIEGELVSMTRPQELPFLVIAVCHAGEPFTERQEMVDRIMAGHALRDVATALQGCAHWYVLSGTDGTLSVYDAPTDQGTLSEQQAHELWTRFNPENFWRVIHVLKVGMPILRA